jgi:hypothetical protein
VIELTFVNGPVCVFYHFTQVNNNVEQKYLFLISSNGIEKLCSTNLSFVHKIVRWGFKRKNSEREII